jgi:CubicO group peptidase (beta-lactamase class C family)
VQAAVPTPQWGQVFSSLYEGKAEGYAYVVAQNGQVVASGAVGLAHSPHENPNPNLPWATTTRMNLASVSKTVTAVAAMSLVQQGKMALTDSFLPYIQSQISNSVGAGVSTVTIADLLSMTSAMVGDGTLYTSGGESIYAFLNTYLHQSLAAGATPGVTYVYSNTNFTILQAVIEQIAASLPAAYTSYTDYVNRAVLAPMGVSTTLFSPSPDPLASATLSYTDASDTRLGYYWPAMQCVGPGGLIAPATEVIKYLIGIRNHTVLTAGTTNTMFTQSLGWYPWVGAYGTYYHHNGGLINGRTPGQG